MEYDLFDILGDKEDSYTNVIKFLFEKSNKFKFELLACKEYTSSYLSIIALAIG